MVRFSCFYPHRPKKSEEGVIRKDGSKSKGLSSIIFGRNIPSVSENSKPSGSTGVERVWKSEEIKPSGVLEHDAGTHEARHLKKSQSHGDELYMDVKEAAENGTDQITSPESCSKRVEGSPPNLVQKDSVSAYQEGSEQALYGSIFSVGDHHHADEDSHQLDETSLLSGEEHMDNSNSQTPYGSPLLVRSNSMPNIADSASEKSSPSHHSRSSDDLHVLDTQQTDKLKQEQDHDRDYDDDGYDYSSMAKDWIVPATDELNSTKFIKGETSNQPAGYPGKDSKFKRIDDWVNDLQHVNSSAEEADEIDDDEFQREPELTTTAASPSVDVMKSTPGMEAAKKYFSSLSSAATTAQLVSRGLVVLPLLSKFVGLRVLNLSGNAIVKITAGALPRGLHALNLSKNCISVIEGLRELTRLRVLDLRYNKILRLGHGLASCSSLKELYLAGNKISNVEGLHRLLKLIVLDLSFNKIATTKAIGQLVANYNSLVALNILGNPIQSNVGEDVLRKTVSSLLPKLVYLNKQLIKPQRAREVLKDSVAKAAFGGGDSLHHRRKRTSAKRVVGSPSPSSHHHKGKGRGSKGRSQHQLKKTSYAETPSH